MRYQKINPRIETRNRPSLTNRTKIQERKDYLALML